MQTVTVRTRRGIKSGLTAIASRSARISVSALMLWGGVHVSADAAEQTASQWKLPRAVQIQRSQEVVITVDPNSVVRSAVPAALFGFNIPWMNFQRGYWRDNQVRPEVIAWLKPFSGAVYRYPGGEWSNWFEWEKAAGPGSSRTEQYTTFGSTKAEFGFDEFLDFVKAVNGVPLVTVNLKGTKGAPWSDQQAVESNVEWLQHSVQREGRAIARGNAQFCQTGTKCPVEWWELGNELDWGNGAWTHTEYVNRAREVGLAMKNIDPAIKLIAHTTSSPWSTKRVIGEKPKARDFDSAVGAGLGDVAYGYAYHPYYDGISIPAANHYMERAINHLRPTASTGKPPPIFITEHGRWPNQPKFGKWETTWIKTGNIGGAVSTADFLLSQMVIPDVRAAMWHSLGARGPWQLFYLDSAADALYPNVVYWALRVLREGLMDDALKVSVSSPNISGYRGGYDVRAVFMRDSTHTRYSLLTINRAGKEQKARLIFPEWAGRKVKGQQYYVSGVSDALANTKERKNAVTMRSRAVGLRFDDAGQAEISLPAFSVSSIVITP